MRQFEIIFDNGGSATLQFDSKFVFFFGHHMDCLAESVKAAMAGEDPADWDGNTPEHYVSDDVYREASQSGGLRCVDSEDCACLSQISDDGWKNIAEFLVAMK